MPPERTGGDDPEHPHPPPGGSAAGLPPQAGGETVTIEGFHALKHAIRFGADISDAVATDPEAVLALAGELAPDVVDRLAALLRPGEGGDHPTAVRATAVRPRVNAAAVLADRRPEPVVFLEHPTHHGNVGAVVRVSAALEAAGVLANGPLDPWHPYALRGSAGLHFAIPVAAVDALPATDRPLVALDPAGGSWSGPWPARSILAFGSERRGLSQELRDRADIVARIQARQGVSSLNLATAVAIALHAGRQHL